MAYKRGYIVPAIERRRMHQLLAAIEAFWREHAYAPSYAQLVRLTGFRSTAMVGYYVPRLEQAGFIQPRTRSMRSLVPVQERALH